MDAKKFGEVVKKTRKSMGITQAYLAALCNTGTRVISDLENGKKTIQLEKALQIARELNIEVRLLRDER